MSTAAHGGDTTATVAAIRAGINALCEPECVYELRVLKAGRDGTASGYFDDLDLLAAAAAEWDGRGLGVYLTLNPVLPALLARAANRVKPRAEQTTSDTDVLRRDRLMIDLDPVRPSGIASTDAEHEAAIQRAREIHKDLTDAGWPPALAIDTGNGCRLDYAIDLPNDAAALSLVKGALMALAFRFDDDVVRVDTTVCNAARIARIPGTMNAKGDSTKDRPHRRSSIRRAPKMLVAVSREQLETLAATAPAAAPKGNGTATGDFDLKIWIAEHEIDVLREGAWQGGRRWLLNACPFNATHVGGSAAILQFPSGAVAFKCQHDGCAGRGWRELRQHFEPNAYAGARRDRGSDDSEPVADSVSAVLVNLDETLSDVAAMLRVYVVFQSQLQLVAISLWVALTHIFDQFETTPYLEITSPEKRSGKTRLLDVLELLAARAWRAVLPSEAVVFRKIARDAPTLLLDEVDAIYGPKAGPHEGLRAILNAGHRRGSTVPRCVGDGHELVDFPVYCPKALAGIGDLPDTVADRSIPIRMQRRSAGEKVDRFRYANASQVAKVIRARLEAWAAHTELRCARPEVPIELNDRAADGWEPLLAIADLAGGEWPALARSAAVGLHSDTADDDLSLGVRLLADIQHVFRTVTTDATGIFTERLLDALHAMDESPWGDLKGKPLPARTLAFLLKPYSIRPTSVRVGDRAAKGYRRDDFRKAWSRYVVAHESADPPKTDFQGSQGHNATESSTYEDFHRSHEDAENGKGHRNNGAASGTYKDVTLVTFETKGKGVEQEIDEEREPWEL